MRVHNLAVRFPEEPCSIQRMPGSDIARHDSAIKPDYQSQSRPSVRLKMHGCCQAGKDKMQPCEESSWRDGVQIVHPVTKCGMLKSYTGGIISSQASVLPVGNPVMGSQCHYLFHHGRWMMPRGCLRPHLGEDICTPIFASCTEYILGCSHHTDRCVRI
jgi:hypothetical protein